jgi:cytochrome c oxidase subunit 1
VHNYDTIPSVHALDEFFHRKYAESPDTGELRQVATAEEIVQSSSDPDLAGVHLPSPSYWPIVLATGLLVLGYGVATKSILIGIGAIVVLWAAFGWAMEPSVEPVELSPSDDDVTPQLVS